MIWPRHPHLGWSRSWRGWAGLVVVAGGLAAGELTVSAAPPSAAEVTRRSDHFIVHDTRQFGRSIVSMAAPYDPDLLLVEPEPLLISAERIREGIARLLGLNARDAAPINLDLYAPLRNDETLVVISTLYANGWTYRVRVPDDVQRLKLVRGLVQAVLTEFSNRGTSGKGAELPTWLIEGMTAQLLAEIGPELVVNSVPKNALRRSVYELQGADAMRRARARLRAQPALSFSQLSQPSGEVLLSGEAAQSYQVSSQVFLMHLLQQPDGPARLVTMLKALPGCWNWQTAFLRAFNFSRLLDVEKWWSVSLTTWTGRDPEAAERAEVWSQRLAEVLATPAQVHVSSNALPQRSEIPLQQVIAEWDFNQQRPVLRAKLNQLSNARLTAPADVAAVIDAYRNCLAQYLQRREQAGYVADIRRATPMPVTLAVQDAVRQLNSLDQQRESLRQARLAVAGPVRADGTTPAAQAPAAMATPAPDFLPPGVRAPKAAPAKRTSP
jgi:hypothetical protein